MAARVAAGQIINRRKHTATEKRTAARRRTRFSAGKRERPFSRSKRVHKQRASVAERSNSPRASERARKQARRYSRTRALSALHHTAAMTKLTFTKDDPPPPESLPDAPRAPAVPTAVEDTEWTAEDAAFMAGWEQSDASDDVSDGEPCPFCGGLGHSVDDCPMRRDTKGEVARSSGRTPSRGLSMWWPTRSSILLMRTYQIS